MPIIKFGNVQIASERLGFPATVVPTEDQVAERVAGLLDERDSWRKKAEDAIALNERNKDREKKLSDMECAIILDEAERTYKIDKVERPFFEKMWRTNPTSVKEHIDALRAKHYLRREQALGNDAEVAPDPFTELALTVAEIRSGDKNISEADAVQRAYRLKDGLFDRVTAARRESKKGGER